MRENSKEKREAESGLVGLKASGVFETIVNDLVQKNLKKLTRNMLLALTWCHCTPADTPASPIAITISTEHQVDHIACASYGSRQGGADTLASNHNVGKRG